MTVRTALVTGVVGGIGAAIARRLSDDGARVVVTDLPGDSLDEAAARLGLPAIPADLVEAELFGHSRGAFSGSDKARTGLFRAAHQGTLLLDGQPWTVSGIGVQERGP